MDRKNGSVIYMKTTAGMTEEQLSVFNGMKNTHGLGEMITRILIAYAHEKGLDKASVSVLDGYARVSEAERSKKGEV